MYIPHFFFALPTDTLHLVQYHYTPLHDSTFPHPFELCYLLLSATLLNFAATKQPFNKFAHLPLHHSTLTFYYAILPNFYYACLYGTFFNFATTNHPSIILLISCHTNLHSLTTFNYTVLYTTSHNSSLSVYWQTPTSIP